MQTLFHTIVAALLLACSTSSIYTATASVIPAHVAPTYALAPGPAIVTAHSNQVVARHYNRLYVPGAYVPAVATHTHAIPALPAAAEVPAYAAYPSYSYAATTASYPGVYRYGAYPYGYYSAPPTYGYGYGGTYW